MRIKQLKQDKADALKAMKTARDRVAAATTDADRDAARAEFKAAEAKFDGIVEELRVEEKLQQEEREMRPAGTDPDVEAAARAAGRVHVGKDNALDDPKKGFKDHREFLKCVIAAGQTGGRRVDARLEPLRQATVGSDEASSQEGQYGAFLVPSGFSPTLLQVLPEDDPTAGKMTEIPMANPIVEIPSRVDKDHTTSVSGGLTVTRKPQTTDITSSRLQTERVSLKANSLFGIGYATEELMTDSPISFIAILQNGFSQQFASQLLMEKLYGKGSGEYTGVINAPCTVSVAKESGQASKTIVKENIDKMIAQCWKYSTAIWLANHDTYPSLASLVQVVGVGGMPVPYLTYDPDGNCLLRGKPLFFSEYPDTVGNNGDLILGVWSEYIHGSYQPLESAESIHVRFVEHERTLKFWLRDDGQPWWKSALTPKKSSSKLSPFVTLAAR